MTNKYLTAPGEVTVYDFELDEEVQFECPEGLGISIDPRILEAMCKGSPKHIEQVSKDVRVEFTNQDDILRAIAPLYAVGEDNTEHLQSDSFFHQGYNTAPAVNESEEWHFAGVESARINGYESFKAAITPEDNADSSVGNQYEVNVHYVRSKFQEVDSTNLRAYTFDGARDATNITRSDDNTDDEITAVEAITNFDHHNVDSITPPDGAVQSGAAVSSYFSSHPDSDWTQELSSGADALSGISLVDAELGIFRVVVINSSDNVDGSTTDFGGESYDPFTSYRVWNKDAKVNSKPSNEIANMISIHYRWGGDVIDNSDGNVLDNSQRTTIALSHSKTYRSVGVRVVLRPKNAKGVLKISGNNAKLVANQSLAFNNNQEQIATTPVSIRVLEPATWEISNPEVGDTITIG